MLEVAHPTNSSNVIAEVGTIVDWQHLPLKKPRVSSPPPVIVPDTGGLETVSRSLEIGKCLLYFLLHLILLFVAFRLP